MGGGRVPRPQSTFLKSDGWVSHKGRRRGGIWREEVKMEEGWGGEELGDEERGRRGEWDD